MKFGPLPKEVERTPAPAAPAPPPVQVWPSRLRRGAAGDSSLGGSGRLRCQRPGPVPRAASCRRPPCPGDSCGRSHGARVRAGLPRDSEESVPGRSSLGGLVGAPRRPEARIFRIFRLGQSDSDSANAWPPRPGPPEMTAAPSPHESIVVDRQVR